MKAKLIFLLLLFSCLNSFAQVNAKVETVEKSWILSVTNATLFGVTTYFITDSNIVVINGTENDSLLYNKKSKIIFETILNDVEKANFIDIVSKEKIDSLKSFYYNPCISDGVELEFRLKWADQIKRTMLSNFYLKELLPFIDFINKKMPEKYRIWYDKVELERDFKKCTEK